jgi:hypothetical protein
MLRQSEVTLRYVCLLSVLLHLVQIFLTGYDHIRVFVAIMVKTFLHILACIAELFEPVNGCAITYGAVLPGEVQSRQNHIINMHAKLKWGYRAHFLHS